MSINKTQLRDAITKVLTYLELNSPAAVELLMMTAAQESALGNYIKQIKGPALGIFQMEPATEKDIWDRYLSKHQKLADKVQALRNTIQITGLPDLETDLDYQIAIARIFYYRIPAALPSETDIVGMANYYKKYFNTYLGKATVNEVIQNYKKYC